MSTEFETKQSAREWVWENLDDRGVARFPYPIFDRIPNFEGAEEAAESLLALDLFQSAERIKVNPDSPQKHVRREALKRGTTVFVPTPRLRDGFLCFEPGAIPREHYRDASMISRWDQWAEPIELDDVPQLDAIVTGCVAVTLEGARCGKGEGYSDLEYGILRELGHDPVPVVTTVHSLQIVDRFPTDPHDLSLRAICTPDATHTVESPPGGPDGVDWSLLDDEDLQAMPILRQLRDRS